MKTVWFTYCYRARQPEASEQGSKPKLHLGQKFSISTRDTSGFLTPNALDFLLQFLARPLLLYTYLRWPFVAWSSLRKVEILAFNASVMNFSFMAYIGGKISLHRRWCTFMKTLEECIMCVCFEIPLTSFFFLNSFWLSSTHVFFHTRGFIKSSFPNNSRR